MKNKQGFIVQRIIMNAITGWISKLVIAISGVILTPVLLSNLGKYEYGVWVAVGQIIGFLLIADLGVANSIGRLISKYEAIGSIDKINSIYSSSMLLFYLLVLIIFVISIAIVDYIPVLLNIDAEYEKTTMNLFLIMAANIIIVFPLRVGRGLIQSKHRYDYIDIITTATKILQLFLILFIAFNEYLSLLVLALLMASLNILSELTIFMLAKRLHKTLHFKFHLINRSSITELFSMGMASVLLSFSALLTQQGAIFLVGIMLGVLYVPVFSIPLLILVIIGSLIGRIGTTFMPIASAYDSRSDHVGLFKLSVYGVRYVSMFGFVIALYISLYGNVILRLWLPETDVTLADIDSMRTILLILLVPFVLARSNQGNRAILLSTGQHWITSIALLSSSIFGLFVTIILVNYSDLGVYSIAFGLAFKLLVGDYYLILHLLFAKYKYDTLEYLKKAYLKPIGAIIPIIIISFIIEIVFDEKDISEFVFGSMLYLFVTVISVYIICIEKVHLKKFLPNKLHAFIKI